MKVKEMKGGEMGMIKVMAIDDEEDFLSLLKLNLEQTGKFKVEAVSRASEALMRIKQYSPDIILLDVNMPDIDGPTIWSKLAEDEETKNIPVVFLTALITKEEEEEYRKQATGRKYSYIAKPVDTDKLISIIENIIG
jgi:CheY-like chemotaxis protein